MVQSVAALMLASRNLKKGEKGDVIGTVDPAESRAV